MGKPKGTAMRVRTQNVSGIQGTGGKMGKAVGAFKAGTTRAATNAGRNKKTK